MDAGDRGKRKDGCLESPVESPVRQPRLARVALCMVHGIGTRPETAASATTLRMIGTGLKIFMQPAGGFRGSYKVEGEVRDGNEPTGRLWT